MTGLTYEKLLEIKAIMEDQVYVDAPPWAEYLMSRGISVAPYAWIIGWNVGHENTDMPDDRCCCECGTHFEGYPEDDYCTPCYERLVENE